jgi:hypothetical protein
MYKTSDRCDIFLILSRIAYAFLVLYGNVDSKPKAACVLPTLQQFQENLM